MHVHTMISTFVRILGDTAEDVFQDFGIELDDDDMAMTLEELCDAYELPPQAVLAQLEDAEEALDYDDPAEASDEDDDQGWDDVDGDHEDWREDPARLSEVLRDW